MNWFDSITAIGALSTFLYMGYQVLFTHSLMYRIERGEKIPQELADFPIHQGTVREYEETKSKIEEFKSAVLQGERGVQVVLKQSDINNLYTQGVSLNKFFPGIYRFFSLIDKRIVIDTIEWPSAGVPNAVWCQRSTIQFEIDESGIKPIALQQVVKATLRTISSGDDAVKIGRASCRERV